MFFCLVEGKDDKKGWVSANASLVFVILRKSYINKYYQHKHYDIYVVNTYSKSNVQPIELDHPSPKC